MIRLSASDTCKYVAFATLPKGVVKLILLHLFVIKIDVRRK